MRQKQKVKAKARLAFRGIDISYEMHVWIQKAQAIRKTAQEIAQGIYEQGKKDHMSKANMLAIIQGVFSDYTNRHLRRITPPELKNVNMARAQPRKQVSEIADINNDDMSANTDDSQEGTKAVASYEINMDLEYNVKVKNWEDSNFMDKFDKAVWSYEENGKDMKYFLTLPVTINVNPGDQTATVQVDKVLLDSWMREKQNKLKK